MKSKKTEEDAQKEDDRWLRRRGMNKRMIQKVLQRYKNEKRVDYKWNSGPKPRALSSKNLNNIKRTFLKKPCSSIRNVAATSKISQSSVQRAKKKVNIVTRKKKSAPKYVKNQKERALVNHSSLRARLLELCT